MQDYISLKIYANPFNEDIGDLIAASLGEIGYESFTADDKGVTAFIKDCEFNLEAAKEALEDFPIDTEFKFESEFVKGEDWNEEWEKNYFQPIVVGEKCVVHSTFHKDIPVVEYDIVIDPKMAFGTGHHSTTSNMMSLLLSHDLRGKSVIDMGTGTGILAILAAMKGAGKVVGIEIDPYACENAVENVKLNGVDVEMICGDAGALGDLEPADVFLANINRNIVVNDLPSFAKALKNGGVMFLSGFYMEDQEIVRETAEKVGMKWMGLIDRENWIALEFVKCD